MHRRWCIYVNYLNSHILLWTVSHTKMNDNRQHRVVSMYLFFFFDRLFRATISYRNRFVEMEVTFDFNALLVALTLDKKPTVAQPNFNLTILRCLRFFDSDTCESCVCSTLKICEFIMNLLEFETKRILTHSRFYYFVFFFLFFQDNLFDCGILRNCVASSNGRSK